MYAPSAIATLPGSPHFVLMRAPRCCHALCATLLCGVLVACQRLPQTVVTVSLPAWNGEAASYFRVSPDGRWALLADSIETTLANLATHRIDTIISGPPETLRARLGPIAASWDAVQPVAAFVPPRAVLQRSPDGRRVAYFVPGLDTVWIGPLDTLVTYALDGRVTGVGWVPHGDLLYTLVRHSDTFTSLDRINVETGAVQPVKERLDAPLHGGGIAVSPDARTLYLALAGDTLLEAGRPRAETERDTEIYALDLATSHLHAVSTDRGDDRHPIVVGKVLYWTHTDAAARHKVLRRLGL
jgi:hypothetical protein